MKHFGNAHLVDHLRVCSLWGIGMWGYMPVRITGVLVTQLFIQSLGRCVCIAVPCCRFHTRLIWHLLRPSARLSADSSKTLWLCDTRFCTVQSETFTSTLPRRSLTRMLSRCVMWMAETNWQCECVSIQHQHTRVLGPSNTDVYLVWSKPQLIALFACKPCASAVNQTDHDTLLVHCDQSIRLIMTHC